EHMDRRQPQVIDQRDAIVGHRADARRGVLRDRPADAAIVQSDDAEMGCEIADDRLPALRIRCESGNQEQRGTAPVALVVEIGVFAREHRHWSASLLNSAASAVPHRRESVAFSRWILLGLDHAAQSELPPTDRSDSYRQDETGG